MSQTRQLAAIMFTDIVGYTALMANDEQKAFAILNKNRSLQKPIVEANNGRWIKELGDGVMASFHTASDAVHAAFTIQRECIRAKDFQLRIGIHLGEVILENDDIYGDGVNIASRIETLGVPDSVLMSKSVRDQVRNNTELSAVSIGTFRLKNVGEPMEIFALNSAGFAIPDRKKIKGKLEEKKQFTVSAKILIPVALLLIAFAVLYFGRNLFSNSQASDSNKLLAILPFENPQQDTSLTYLSDGIPENLINRLSNYDGVKVFARSATFRLPDSSRNVPSLRRLLNADVILTGRVENQQGNYALNCELVDAVTQSHIWGNKFQLTSQDISKVEDSIVNSITSPLNITLPKKANDLQNSRKANPAAYAEYMKGRYLSYGSTSEESEKALAHFREAIKIDPKYAAAYAAIGNEKINQSLFSTAPSREIVNEARTAIEAAKALNPNLPEIYTSEGALKFYFDWDWQGAVEAYKKALELDSGNATIYIRYSATLADVGRYKEALTLADKAVELDPVSISSLHNLGWTNLVASNFQKSADAFQKALDLHPNWIWGYIKQAYAFIFLHQNAKALANVEKAQSLFKDGWGSELLQVTLAFIYLKCNEKQKADTVINRFFDYASKNQIEDPWDMSYIYYLKRDYQKAAEWEAKAIDVKSTGAYLMNIDIFYDKEYFESKAHQENLKRMGIGGQDKK